MKNHFALAFSYDLERRLVMLGPQAIYFNIGKHYMRFSTAEEVFAFQREKAWHWFHIETLVCTEVTKDGTFVRVCDEKRT